MKNIKSLIKLPLLTFTLLTLFLSCNKDQIILDSQINLRNGATCLEKVSFDVLVSTDIQMLNEADTLCTLDLLHLMNNNARSSIQSCKGEDGKVCTTIEFEQRNDHRNAGANPMTSEYLDDLVSMEICDNLISYTSQTGKTETFTNPAFGMANDYGAWFFDDPITVDSLLFQLSNNNNGVVTEIENYFIVNYHDANNNFIMTYLDKDLGQIRYTEIKDLSGLIIEKTIFEYICLNEKIYPKSITELFKEITPYCQTSINRKQTTTFSNLQIH